MHKADFDIKKLCSFIVIAAFSLYVSITLPIRTIDNDIASFIVTVFSVLAGFMTALMAITAYVPFNYGWKKLSLRKQNVEASLLRQQMLFYGYLITLALIALSIVLGEYNIWGLSEMLTSSIKRLYVFIASISFIYSFTLPVSLKKAHLENIDQGIQNNKNEK